MVRQNFLKLPGRSGMVTARIASRCSPSSVRSAMCCRRSKLVLAPELMHTRVSPLAPVCWMYFLRPASDRAPEVSETARVSSKMSLTAAHISSVLTVMTSSTRSRITAKGASPTWATATPSANTPTWSSTTRSPLSRAALRLALSSDSTPITLISGRRYFT